MIQIKKTILTLVALLAVTTGAWADETYTITFAANGNTKTVENVTLPKTFQCNYDKANGELDLILKELYSWTGNANQTFCDGETTPQSSDENKVVAGSDNGDHYITINNVFEGTVTITGYYVVNSVVIETPYSLEISIAASPSGPKVAWDKEENTGTFKAALTAAPTAINDVPATTDGAIVKAGTVATIGSSETAQGTVMYYVSTTALDDAALLALAADKWTADVPTAKSLAQGQGYVYYYVRGNDSDTDGHPGRQRPHRHHRRRAHLRRHLRRGHRSQRVDRQPRRRREEGPDRHRHLHRLEESHRREGGEEGRRPADHHRCKGHYRSER